MRKIFFIFIFLLKGTISLAQVSIEFKILPGSTGTLNGNIELCNNSGAALPAGYYIDFNWPGFTIVDLSSAPNTASNPSPGVTRLKFENWMLPGAGSCKTISVNSTSTYNDDFVFPAFGTDSKGNKVTVVAKDPKFIPQSYNSEPKEFYIQKECFIPSPSSLCLGEAQFEEWNRIADVRVPVNRKGWALAAAHAHRMFTNMMGCEVTSLNFSFATSMIEGRMGCDAGFQPPASDDNPLTYESHITTDGCFQIRPLGWVQLEDFYPHIFTNLSKAPITDDGNFITACLSKTLYDYTSFTFWDQYFCYKDPKGFLCNAKDPYAGDAMFAYMYHKGWNHSDFDKVFNADRNTWINSNNVANLLATNYPDINGGYAERVRNNIIRLENNVGVGPSLVVSTAQDNWDPANYEFHGCYDAPFTWAEVSSYIDEACRVFITANKAAVKGAAKVAFDALNGGGAVNFSKLGPVIDAIVLAIPIPSANKGMAGKYFSQAELCSKGNIKIKSYDKICPGQNAQMNVYLFGVPPFSYTIQAPNGTTYSKSGVTVPTDYYTVNQPGEYKIIAFSDANGPVDLKCNVARTTVENAGNATAKWNKSSVNNGCASGDLKIDLSGTAPFTIKYKDATGTEKTVVINSSTSPYTLIAAPVPTGTYVLTHLSAGGCDGPLNDSITFCNITSCIKPSATLSGNASFCQGDSVLISVLLTGTAPWKIKYSNGATSFVKSGIGNNPFTFYAKSAGTYKVDSVWDANCDTLGKGSAIVTVNSLPSISMPASRSICPGSSAVLQPAISGGDGNYTYQWSNAASGTQNSFTANSPGYFTVQVSDGKGCKDKDSTSVSVSASLNVNLKNDSICSGDSITISSGYAGSGYTFLWNSGETSSSINTKTAGTHSVTVNNNGCSGNGSMTLTVFTPPSVSLGADKNICAGTSATLDAGIFFSYLWSSGENSQSIVKGSGTYSLIVSDSNACFGYDTITINSIAKPTPDVLNDVQVCPGNSVTLNASTFNNGNGPYTYLWDDNSSSPSLTISNITTDKVHYVDISDKYNCTGRDSASITVKSVLSIQITGNPDTVMCEGESIILSSSHSANNGYNLLWSTGETTDNITVNTSGAVTLSVNDGAGCSGSDVLNVVVNPLPDISGIPDSVLICDNETAVLNALNPNASYLWNIGASTQSINVNTGGWYWVEISNANCKDTAKIVVEAITLPQDFIDSKKTIFCFEEEGRVVLGASLPNASLYDYTWNTGEKNQSIEVTKEGTYILKVSLNNCSAQDEITFTEFCTSSFFIPNSFSPNGDNQNDIFMAEGKNIRSFEMLIFNRWGELIFESNDIKKGWNGTYKSTLVQQDVYVYKVKYSIDSGNGKEIVKERMGAVTVIY